ncbi:MAG: TonB-dependent receptor [Gemmatimonadota bacterium]|nr:TonB-dependent receptor [Gemmatimonadota bacterium]
MNALLVAASLLVATLAQAQNPPVPEAPAAAKTGKAAITGIVVDSLHGDYLIGAEVIVEGARVSVFTDSFGRFRLDSLASGTYQVGVFHPLLDTLGLSLATRPFHVGPDSVSVISLAVPSASTIIARSCAVRPRAQGNSAVIGQVIDPETLQPVQGADVSIAWTEFEVGKEFGVRQSPRVVRDSTDALGRFSLCGLPNSMEASLQAQRGNSLTAQVPIALGERAVELFARTLLLSPLDSGTKTGNAVLSGRVVLEGNAPGGGSRVEIAGTDAVTTTDPKGEFTLRNLPSGSHVVVARHLGYAADVIPVDLSSREAKTVTITLPKYVNVMDPVLVTARRTASLDRVGFARRQKSGAGYFIGPEQLTRMRPQRVTDVLRQVPGLRVNYGPEGETVSSSRGVGSLMGGNCVQYYVDDMRWTSASPGDVNSFVSGHEIRGVEVYQGSATPAQYSAAGMGNCTTIVLWTGMRIRD